LRTFGLRTDIIAGVFIDAQGIAALPHAGHG
jgi:hypothetical protein